MRMFVSYPIQIGQSRTGGSDANPSIARGISENRRAFARPPAPSRFSRRCAGSRYSMNQLACGVHAVEADHALDVHRGAGLHLDVGVAAGVVVPISPGVPEKAAVADEREGLVAAA